MRGGPGDGGRQHQRATPSSGSRTGSAWQLPAAAAAATAACARQQHRTSPQLLHQQLRPARPHDRLLVRRRAAGHVDHHIHGVLLELHAPHGQAAAGLHGVSRPAAATLGWDGRPRPGSWPEPGAAKNRRQLCSRLPNRSGPGPGATVGASGTTQRSAAVGSATAQHSTAQHSTVTLPQHSDPATAQ